LEQPAGSVAPPDLALVVMRGDGSRLDKGRLLLERAVWPMRVVVGDVLAQYPLEVRARDDQDAIEALAPHAADPPLRVRLRPRRRDRRPNDPDPFRAEDLVEAGREVAVAVADQEGRRLLLVGRSVVPVEGGLLRSLRQFANVP
jgi:hypothetical protein